MVVRRGDIWWVDYEGSNGSEQHGNRPAIIVSNDVGNRFAPIVEIVWLTTAKKKDLPTHVKIDGFGTALCEQIQTVDKERLIDLKGICNEEEILKLNRAMLTSLGVIL